MRVEVEIGTIEIDALPGGDVSEDGIRQALIENLTNRFSTGTLPVVPHSSASHAEITAQHLRDREDQRSATLGQQIGLAISKGVTS